MGLSPDSFSLETVSVALLLKVSRTEALCGLGVPRCVLGVTLPTGVGNLERVTHRELKASDAVNATAFCFRYVPTIQWQTPPPVGRQFHCPYYLVWLRCVMEDRRSQESSQRQ